MILFVLQVKWWNSAAADPTLIMAQTFRSYPVLSCSLAPSCLNVPRGMQWIACAGGGGNQKSGPLNPAWLCTLEWKQSPLAAQGLKRRRKGSAVQSQRLDPRSVAPADPGPDTMAI